MQNRVIKTNRSPLHREVAALEMRVYSDLVETEIKPGSGYLSYEEMAEILEAVAAHFRQLDLPPKLKQVDGI